jgi:flagellin
MSLVLNTNYSSLVAQDALSTSGGELSTALQQLSSGLRVNTAADDAAGYAIIQGMTSQINGLNQAAQNANDGVSLAQTAQGALTEITNDLQTMRDLAVESLNATNSSQDRADLDQQFQQLSQDIDNVAKTASFNGVTLLDGSFSGATFQIGPNAGQSITVSSVSSARTSALGESYGANLVGSKLTAATGITAAGQFTINGTDIYNGTAIAGDAKDIAAAINNAGIQGVTATVVGTASAAGTYTKAETTAGTGTLTINGIGIAVNDTAVQATNVANALAAINANSAATGVTATNVGGTLQLSAPDGRNITVSYTNGSSVAGALSDFGLGGVGPTVYGSYNLSYTGTAGLTVAGSVNAAGTTGLANVVQASAQTGTAISNADVLSVSTANAALSSIDAALQQVAATGAQLGAYQDRFQAAIQGIQTDSTNLQSARSGIQDTDYAAATSQLSKAQILQQASTAMVAQANTIPQNILTLLQKLP